MQHSYETLDRPGGYGRLNLLAPLRHRDFRVLWAGMTISLVGDGVFLVALAWQVYTLWNAPEALAIVGLAMTVPMIAFLLPGGVLGDRLDRRVVMFAADVLRAIAIATIAALLFARALHMWEVVVLTALYGTGTAFFTPAFEAVVPDLLPADDLPAANSMDQFVRPIALRLIGPALGGWIIASVGSSFAFAFDAATFGFSTLTVVSIASLPRPTTEHLSLIDDVRSGLQFIRHRVWIWGTLASAAVAYLLFLGPTEVLLPYLVKDGLHGSASTLGLVFASGGVGAIGSAIVMGQRGQPNRPITVIYVTWTAATLAIAGYGLATASWQLMLTCLAFNVFETAGTIVWATLKQRNVPAHLLSRVSSLDWLISIALLPVSLALTAPVAGYLGARLTLILAGTLGAAVTLGALFLPGMRDLQADDTGQPREESAPEVVVTRLVLDAVSISSDPAEMRRRQP